TIFDRLLGTTREVNQRWSLFPLKVGYTIKQYDPDKLFFDDNYVPQLFAFNEESRKNINDVCKILKECDKNIRIIEVENDEEFDKYGEEEDNNTV
ncbi:MAG: hypothetical protein EZS28_048914, partial [Streblomastix strix]